MINKALELVKRASPYLTAALTAYGGEALTQAGVSSPGSEADVGRRILQTVWQRQTHESKASLASALRDAIEDEGDPDAMAALRHRIKRALGSDQELLNVVSDLLSAAGVTDDRAESEARLTVASIAVRDIETNHSATITHSNLDRAVPLSETALAQQEILLGDTHPNTLTARNNLATAYQEAGDLDRAITLYEATLAQHELILGDTHPNTLVIRNNLALAYREAGDLDRAVPLLEATLAQHELILGDTHPNTLAARNNLAAAYREAGDLDRAITLYEATLAQHELILGDTHPNTLVI
ncbi:tetratricopeptide repeat protein, partial [Kitasatospora sp. NPDC004723]|uniref:tetratricopeptide repeat protein n=1 Tax=Kitasatospora sp. NPDC004723 TaxID=3154288 RepID=UPI0033BF1477